MNNTDQKTILYVEDEAIIAMIIERDLEKYGYNVITEKTGEQAIKRVRKNPEIALILMDVVLGDGMDGIETAKIILKKHSLPIVFFTVHTDPQFVGRVKKINTYGYLVKNSSPAVLDVSIKMALKHFEAHNKMLQEIEKCRKAEEEIKKQLDEKEILLKEVHFRIKSNVASVENLLSTRLKTTNKSEDFSALQNAIGTFGEIVPSVYHNFY